MITRLIVAIIYTNVKSLCCALETNIMLYVRYASISKLINKFPFSFHHATTVACTFSALELTKIFFWTKNF